MSIAEWVRQALAAARRGEPASGIDKKLAAIRAAARFDYPTADIDQMLAEIEEGYANRRTGPNVVPIAAEAAHKHDLR